MPPRTAGKGSAPIQAAASRGLATPSSALPHRDAIQRLFGRHDVSSIQAHVGQDAAASTRSMKAKGFASGNHVVLGQGADLFTAAHEAAHVVQQRRGIKLDGGVGKRADAHERHADEVASRVVRGKPVEALLDRAAGPTTGAASPPGGPHRVQRQEDDYGEDSGSLMCEMPNASYDDAAGGGGGAPGSASVEVCHRDADAGFPGQDTFDWQHYWLRTSNREGGMHPQPGGDPGYWGGLLSDTAMDDHTGAGNTQGSSCAPADQLVGHDVDPQCVNDQLNGGRPTGKWVPFFNDCEDEVERILEECRVEHSPIEDGAGYE